MAPQTPQRSAAPRRSRGAPRSKAGSIHARLDPRPRATLPRAVDTLLDVIDLQTHFVTRGGVVRAVDGVSWDVAEGETVALVGESGCGKSVSALSIMRLVAAPAGRIVGGRILFKGRDLLTLDEEAMRRVRGREIAMIFQEPMTSLNPVLTIGRQMTEGLETHLAMTPTAARTRAAELLSLVGIPDPARRLAQYPHQFSGGMRQRMMIAMALACEPSLVLADEPTTALDVTIQAQILELMKSLSRRLDEPRRARLDPIEGQPPDLSRLPGGCAFAPRCAFCVERCVIEIPPLRPIGASSHVSACWEAERVRGVREPAAARTSPQGGP